MFIIKKSRAVMSNGLIFSCNLLRQKKKDGIKGWSFEDNGDNSKHSVESGKRN